MEKSGSWYARKGGEKIGQGKEAVRDFFLRHPDKADALEQSIRKALSSTSNIIDNVVPEKDTEDTLSGAAEEISETKVS